MSFDLNGTNGYQRTQILPNSDSKCERGVTLKQLLSPEQLGRANAVCQEQLVQS